MNGEQLLAALVVALTSASRRWPPSDALSQWWYLFLKQKIYRRCTFYPPSLTRCQGLGEKDEHVRFVHVRQPTFRACCQNEVVIYTAFGSLPKTGDHRTSTSRWVTTLDRWTPQGLTCGRPHVSRRSRQRDRNRRGRASRYGSQSAVDVTDDPPEVRRVTGVTSQTSRTVTAPPAVDRDTGQGMARYLLTVLL